VPEFLTAGGGSDAPLPLTLVSCVVGRLGTLASGSVSGMVEGREVVNAGGSHQLGCSPLTGIDDSPQAGGHVRIDARLNGQRAIEWTTGFIKHSLNPKQSGWNNTPNMHDRMRERSDIPPVLYTSLLRCFKHVDFILFTLCLSRRKRDQRDGPTEFRRRLMA